MFFLNLQRISITPAPNLGTRSLKDEVLSLVNVLLFISIGKFYGFTVITSKSRNFKLSYILNMFSYFLKDI